jgi:hypothetical protein
MPTMKKKMEFKTLDISKEKKLPVKEFKLDEECGVEAIAIVEFPAIELDYMKFNKTEKMNFAITNEDEQIFTGPLMVPDKLIYRVDEKGEEYYGFFSSQTIKIISQKYLIEGRQDRVNLEHQTPIDGIYLVESWLVKDSEKDKAAALGYDVPVNTWMGSMKVTDKNMWEELKNGDFNGFSIEGHFIKEDTKDTKNEELMSKIFNILEQVDCAAGDPPNFINEKTLKSIKPEHLEVLYQWFEDAKRGDEACPACLKWASEGAKPLSFWLNNAIPRIKTGENFGGLLTNYATDPYGTFCEDKCRCKLIRVITVYND